MDARREVWTSAAAFVADRTAPSISHEVRRRPVRMRTRGRWPSSRRCTLPSSPSNFSWNGTDELAFGLRVFSRGRLLAATFARRLSARPLVAPDAGHFAGFLVPHSPSSLPEAEPDEQARERLWPRVLAFLAR